MRIHNMQCTHATYLKGKMVKERAAGGHHTLVDVGRIDASSLSKLNKELEKAISDMKETMKKLKF